VTGVFAHSLSHTKRATILKVIQEFHIGELPFVKSQPKNKHTINYSTAISSINLGTLSISSRGGGVRRKQFNRKAGRTRLVLAERINEIVLLRSRSPGSLCFWSQIFLALSLLYSSPRSHFTGSLDERGSGYKYGILQKVTWHSECETDHPSCINQDCLKPEKLRNKTKHIFLHNSTIF